MKNLFNLHLIETKEGKFRFSVLLQNSLVITDGMDYSSQEEAISGMLETTKTLNRFLVLDTLDKVREWEM